jgi:hypothetical protein
MFALGRILIVLRIVLGIRRGVTRFLFRIFVVLILLLMMRMRMICP